MSRRENCRSCEGRNLQLVLALGDTPLANSLLTTDAGAPEPRFPLDLVYCVDCTLVQITETVPPEQLFREYLYFSSFSDTMLSHARELVERLLRERRLGPTSLAMEIASNDGYLLQYYKQAGVPVLGIEPARNVARVAIEERGIATISEFFGLSFAQQLASEGRRADVLHANNVLAHVADLPGFVAGIRAVLTDDGIAALEFPYLGDMIERCEFDTIYHEHLCYFSLTAITNLLARTGLQAIAVERLPIHGGSLLLTVARAESAQPRGASVAALLAEEKARGMTSVEFYLGFGKRVAELRAELCALLARLKAEGRSIAAYGAAAKGSTLLNTFGIGRETLDFVADRSTHKQGHYMPGVHIPIVAPSKLSEARPDYTLLLTWNFADEILAQQAEYRRLGGEVHRPDPTREGHLIFAATSVDGAFVIRPERIEDERGFFARTFCVRELAEHGIDPTVVQRSVSYNKRRGTLRGMHYQIAPHAENKLVSCQRGAIHDVIIDLRPGSTSYRRWFGVDLTAEGFEALFIPRGCAHGFITLTDDALVHYELSEFYHPESARGVRYDDPAFGVEWPMPPVVINARDAAYPYLSADTP